MKSMFFSSSHQKSIKILGEFFDLSVLLLLWSIPHEITCHEYFHPFLYYLKYNLSSIIKTPSKFSIISQFFALFLPNLKLFLIQLNHFIQLLYLVFFQGIQDFFQQSGLFVNCCSWLR